jgi:ABC-2 type transport system ATP-binding protein
VIHNNQAALRFTGVRKSFGKKLVLSGLDFEVQPGDFTVLLGPNGAGKSTSISLANGLLSPDQGTIEIFGFTSGTLKARAAMGYVPQEPAFPAHVRAIDLLEFSAAHSQTSGDMKALIKDLEISSFLQLPVRHLSGGQKRLVSVGCAFALGAPLVILDEPTTGLDIEMRQRVWRLLEKYREGGGAILMTTHYLAEAEALAGRIVVLAAGTVLHSGSPAEIKRRYGYKRIQFTASQTPPTPWSARALQGHGRWSLDSGDPDKALTEILAWGHASDIDVAPLALEDVFLRLIGRPN